MWDHILERNPINASNVIIFSKIAYVKNTHLIKKFDKKKSYQCSLCNMAFSSDRFLSDDDTCDTKESGVKK